MMSPPEVERRRTLTRYKALATGLLILATLIYLLCRWLQLRTDAPWIGFVRAASEAGMIGGLADWFAVTALFRYPLGLKIPHTAIIKNNKDRLGNTLSEFVGENFLNAELIVEKVRAAGVPNRIGEWLQQPDNAQRASQEIGKFIDRAVRAIDPADAEDLIDRMLVQKLSEPAWGPPAGRLLESLISDHKVEPVVQEVAGWAHRKTVEGKNYVVATIDERMPSWAPQFVNQLVGDKVYRELVDWTQQVAEDKRHPARAAIRRFITQFAYDLQFDPVTGQRVEQLKADIMGSEPVQKAAATLWAATSDQLIQASGDGGSIIRRKATEIAQMWGENLLDSAELRERLDAWIERYVRILADNYTPEITAIISETVRRWDAEEASNKIELMVGKDLQYIRLNGTIVGSLAGLAIYAISYILFGG